MQASKQLVRGVGVLSTPPPPLAGATKFQFGGLPPRGPLARPVNPGYYIAASRGQPQIIAPSRRANTHTPAILDTRNKRFKS